MSRVARVKRYVRRYESWKQRVVASSVFVIVCGFMAVGYLAYRAVLLSTPIATIEHSIFGEGKKNASVICQDDDNRISDHLPLLSQGYQARIRSLTPEGKNAVANADLSKTDPVTGGPTGYSRTVEGKGLLYERGQDSDKARFLRVVDARDKSAGQVKPAWQMNPVSLPTGSSTHAYSFWYRSTTPVAVSLEYTLNKRTRYEGVTTLEPSRSWQQFTGHFSSVLGPSDFRFAVTGTGSGQVDTKGFAIHRVPDGALAKGQVSVAFDDGWKSIYDKALPLLREYDIKTTQYVISEAAARNVHGYLSYADVTEFRGAGHEIGSHSLNHCDQTSLTAQSLQDNAVVSKQWLESKGLGPITTFSYPLGFYNKTTQQTYERHYPLIRTSDFGYNDRYFDSANVRSISVESDTSDAVFQGWLNYARERRLWVVLVYHRVDESGKFSVSSDQLRRQLAMIRGSGLEVRTMSEAARAARDESR